MTKNENKNELACVTGIGFSKRDENVKGKEETGEIEFKVISNDGTLQNLKLLTNLKNIIAKQLPKMPKEYIVRLVFDKRHQSMIIIQKSEKTEKVLGGICYRPNKEQHFIEIAFLAISSLEQVKGYGTRLMNKLKDHCKEQGIEYFLTYADNNAIGYFKKQGFDKSLKLPMEKWKGYIKDYDGGTLMEAACNKEINYSNLSSILKMQKEKLKEIGCKFLNKKKKYSCRDLEKSLNKNNIDISQINNSNDSVISEDLFNAIPGMKESGWTYNIYMTNLEQQKKMCLLEACRELLKKIKADSNNMIFFDDLDTIIGYKEKIPKPINIPMIDHKLENGDYKTGKQFVDDIKLMFNNCLAFNGKNSFYGKNAKTNLDTHEAEMNELEKKYIK